MNDYHLKYPIGEFTTPSNYNHTLLREWISDIEKFPKQVDDLCSELDQKQLNLVYRPGGWTIKQVVHHCADSHMNAYVRFKLTLTEDTPSIRPYFEDRWANLIDSQEDDIHFSLMLLKGLHHRWVQILNNLSSEDYIKCYFHPEHQKEFELQEAIANYSWHCKHHLEHIKLALGHVKSNI